VAVCFEPEEDCTALAVDAIDRAEQQILVNAYGLTTNSGTSTHWSGRSGVVSMSG
jgi:hypothetical protein